MTLVASRHLGYRRAFKVLCLCVIVMMSLPQHKILMAADKNPFSLTSELRIKEVVVSGKDTSQWPKGSWYPVPLNQYQSLKKKALLKKSTPRNSWIQEATYEAQLKDDHLIDGRLKYELHCSRDEPEFIDLTRLNLAIHDLKWGEHPAVWGLTPDQKNMLLVDHFDKDLVGQWSLKGRQLPQRLEFSFQLPETVVSRVHLKVPQGMILTTSTGYVSGPLKSDVPGFDLWQIELGGQSRFQVVVHQQEKIKSAPTQVLYHQSAQVGIREDGLRLREDFQIEVLNKPVSKLEFEAPTEFEIYSVTLGNDLALPFEIKKEKEKNQITVNLIDPLIGVSRPLTVRALASPSLDGEVLIPRLTLKQAHFLGGTVHVDISAPLETHQINFVDLRQTSVLIQEEQGEAYDFKQYSADANLTYQLALPDLNLSAKVQSLIQVDDKVGELKSRIHWTSAAGSTYRLEALIPIGWKITQVSSLAANNSGDLVWDVEQSERQQKLRVRLPVSVSPESPYLLEIHAQRLFPVTDQSVDLFGVKPLDCTNVDRLMEISGVSEETLRFDPGKEVEELLSSELPKNWGFPVSNSDQSRFFHLAPYSGSRWGRLFFSHVDQSLQVNASTYVSLADDVLKENYTLTCVPAPGGIQSILIYLSEEGGAVKWFLPSDKDSQSKFKAKKQPVSEHQKWQLPSQGELWELSFATPVLNEIEIRGERRQSFLKSTKLALIHTPQANPFQGVIRVLNSKELNLRIKADGVFPASEANHKTKILQNQGSYEWEYERPSGTISLSRFSDMPDENSEQATAKIAVKSAIGHGNGEPDVHHATILLDLSKTYIDKFVFHFLSDVKLISTTVNEQRVTPIEIEGQYLIPLFDQQDVCQITIQYQTLSPPDHLTVKRQIPFPQINQQVLETDWNIFLPEGVDLVAGPENMVLRETVPQGSLSRRFFGILGHHQGKTDQTEKLWNAVVLFPVKYGTLKTSNSSIAQTLSWIVLLATLIVGLLLRVFCAGIRIKLCLVIALISFMISWIYPIALAQISGSCFTGILIVMLLPRRFLRQAPKSQIGNQSTKAYRPPVSTFQSTARFLVIAILGVNASSFAQKTPSTTVLSSVKQSNVIRTELVLLPEQSGSITEPYAYLSPDLLYELERITTDEKQLEYLLSSSRYEGVLHENQLLTVKAIFDVKIPVERSSALIRLPVSGGNLGGPNSCLVDGKVSPALFSADKKNILIKVKNEKTRLPNTPHGNSGPLVAQKPIPPFSYQNHQIELVLHPALKIHATSGQFELGIPRISKNHFHFQFNDSVHFVEITDDTGISQYHLAGKTQFSTFLRESSLLKVKWQTNQDPEDTPLSLDATVLTSARISPSLIQMKVRVKYNVLNGKVDYLTWKLPVGTILRGVNSPGVLVIPALNAEDGQKYEELLLEFSESKTGEFVIDAVFDLPSSHPMAAVNIPIIDFSSGTINSRIPTINIVSHQLGVQIGPEFEVEQERTLPDGVVSISSKSNSKKLENSILKSSALLFQIDQPVPVSLTLKPKNPERKARVNQTVVVDKKNIDWTYSAELRISQAPAFRHTLVVPDGLKIESLSVKEEDVERLAHWHRIGNEITLFLKNKTSGLQDLTLKGWLPLRKYGNLDIPSIQLKETVVEDSHLSLYKKPQIDVKVTSSHYRRLQDNSTQTPVPTDHISFVGRFQVIDFANLPVSLLIKLQDSLISVDSLTIIDSPEDRKIEVTQTLRFSLPTTDLKKLYLLIPEEYGSELTIDGMPHEIQDKISDNMRRVELHPGSTGNSKKTITVRATINKPINEFVVLPVMLEKSKVLNNYLLLSSAQAFHLFDQKISKTVLPENVPAWIQARCNTSSQLDCEAVFVSSQSPWKLISSLSNLSDSNMQFIPFVESEIFIGDQGIIRGLTQIKLFNQTRRVLKIAWPEKTNLVAVMVNGEFNTTFDPVKQNLEIPLSGVSDLSEIALFWESHQMDHNIFLQNVRLQTPRPVNFRVDKELIKIYGSDKNRVLLSNSVSPFQYFAEKLEEQLKIAEIELEVTRAAKVSYLTWEAINSEFKQLETILTDLDINRQENQEELNQFNILKERVFTLKQYIESDPKTNPQELTFVRQFQQKLKTVPQQNVRYYFQSENGGLAQNVPDAWVIPNRYLELMIACLCLLILLPVAARCIHSRTANWLNRHPATGLLALGFIWILFMSLSFIGIVIIFVSILVAMKAKQIAPLSINEPDINDSNTNLPESQIISES